MSETDSTATTASEPQPENECPDGMVKDPETGECVPKADQDVAGAGAAASAEKGFAVAMKAILKETTEEMRKEFKSMAKAMMDEVVTDLKTQFSDTMRKELGLKKDPAVTKSELEAAIRKGVLDLKASDTGKRTPASPAMQKAAEDKPKAGDIFKNYGAN